ncbi:zf-HC2 domain-containing protein, partial [Promicromonospora sp. NPDC060271]|uniref:zf-HC2 domain-containing protein n=1 Tax=Promicromonospora sp. NPDC060271 TaxID=3347089 RepID=UPI00365281CB
HLGVRPHAVTMRLRRAEERLAGAFAAAHAQGVGEPECRTTRAAMHDYLKGRLLPRRQRRLEVHMDGCGECTRAFVDVREVSWMLRDLGQHLIAGGWATGAVGAVGAVGAGAGGARPRSFGKKETAVAAGVLAALAIGGAAAAMIANQADQPPIQAIEDAGAGDGAGGGTGGGGAGGGGGAPGSPEEATQERPPSIPPADPAPRPATTPKEDAEPAPAPEQQVADPEPADDNPPAAEPAPGGGADRPDPVKPPTQPQPEPEPTEPPNPPEPTDPPDPPDPTDPPDTPDPETPGPGAALDALLLSLGLSDLPGIDLATMTLDEIWALFFGTVGGNAGQAADDAQSAVGN